VGEQCADLADRAEFSGERLRPPGDQVVVLDRGDQIAAPGDPVSECVEPTRRLPFGRLRAGRLQGIPLIRRQPSW